VNQEGARRQGVQQGDYTVVDAEGGVHRGTLDGNGFASVAGLPMGMAMVSYGEDPRDPWDEGSYFGRGTEWPAVALSEAGAKPAAGSLNGAAGKFGAIAQAAKHAARAVQSLQKDSAQALLAPIGQTALANVVGKFPGTAPPLGLPGTLPDIGAELPSSSLKKSIV